MSMSLSVLLASCERSLACCCGLAGRIDERKMTASRGPRWGRRVLHKRAEENEAGDMRHFRGACDDRKGHQNSDIRSRRTREREREKEKGMRLCLLCVLVLFSLEDLQIACLTHNAPQPSRLTV